MYFWLVVITAEEKALAKLLSDFAKQSTVLADWEMPLKNSKFLGCYIQRVGCTYTRHWFKEALHATFF